MNRLPTESTRTDTLFPYTTLFRTHHDHEKGQHRHSADVDHHQDHGNELGAHQHEEAGGVEESENQKQHGVHGVARTHHHDSGGHGDDGEEIEGQRLDDHAAGLLSPSSTLRSSPASAPAVWLKRTNSVPQNNLSSPLPRPSGLSGRAHRAPGSGRSRIPSDRRSPAASPCCRAAPRGSRWRIRSSALPRWHPPGRPPGRSEEHTSELQSLMRISYAVFCLKKKKH